MAVIHHTTMDPTKLELLASWLPGQSWYAGAERGPELSIAGGFRLDDPEGEVGIELMVVTDDSGGRPVTYHVPLAYRGAPLDGAGQGLIGTTEHGVLGKRWVYDGAHDPVVVDRLLALLQSRAEPQAQNETGTPDPSVTVLDTGDGLPGATEVTGTAAVTDGTDDTRITVETSAGPLTVRVMRLPRPDGQAALTDTTGARSHVTAGWRLPDGSGDRAVFFTLHDGAA